MMTSRDWSAPSVQALDASVVVDSSGGEIGKVGQVYIDKETGQASRVTDKTGWFGSSEPYVPLDSAMIGGDTIRAPYDKAKMKSAPAYEAGEPLNPTDERELHAHSGLIFNIDGVITNDGGTTSRAGYLDSSEYLTRSQGQLHVGTEMVETGRARLRKVGVTEQHTVTVPVTEEEVRVVREPIAPGDSVDATIGDAAVDVILTEERVVVSKETVPVEKVRLDNETVTKQRGVTEAVRKEQIGFDDATSAVDNNERPGERSRQRRK